MIYPDTLVIWRLQNSIQGMAQEKKFNAVMAYKRKKMYVLVVSAFAGYCRGIINYHFGAYTCLNLCIRETPKRVLLPTVKTQMKCRHNAAFHLGHHCL